MKINILLLIISIATMVENRAVNMSQYIIFEDGLGVE